MSLCSWYEAVRADERHADFLQRVADRAARPLTRLKPRRVRQPKKYRPADLVRAWAALPEPRTRRSLAVALGQNFNTLRGHLRRHDLTVTRLNLALHGAGTGLVIQGRSD